MIEEIGIGGFSRSKEQLHLSFFADDLRFSTVYWYGDVDLEALESRFGSEFMEWIYFHIAAFEINKLASLAPKQLSLGPFERFYDEEFESLWRTVLNNVFGEWRYRNNQPSYQGPKITAPTTRVALDAVTIEPGPTEILAFSGGGKDSLISQRLLERCGEPYGVFAYASSIYGRLEPQHRLIESLLDKTNPSRRHRAWIFDDFLDSPLLSLKPELGIGSVTAGETPSSLFSTLPVALAHGYTVFALAHEASASDGNLVWDATGETVNHQWGKSVEAQKLLGEYLRTRLASNLRYASTIQPLRDPVLFHMLNEELDAVDRTHSCNVQKPWCKRCAKCAYVWLGYAAFLPLDRVDAIFGENLLEAPENHLIFRQLLGLEAHTPFECVGQAKETRLMFWLARKKGLTGPAMEVFTRELADYDPSAELDTLFSLGSPDTAWPQAIGQKISRELERAAKEAKEYVRSMI